MAVVTGIGSSLSQNLRSLCDRERSIAEVCREIGINRQQFNKYLSGATFPSRSTLRRICESFGIGESDILRPPGEFRSLFSNGAVAQGEGVDHFTAGLGLGPVAREAQHHLRRFVGYYYSCYTSPICPDMIIRSVLSLYERSGAFYSRGVERLRGDGGNGRTITSKYHGYAASIGDRIYFLYVTRTAHSNLSFVTLYPSHRSVIDLMTGVFSGVSSGSARQPFAGHVVYEYLGTEPDLRAALRGTGLFPFDSPRIRSDIRKLLKVKLSPGENYLASPQV